MREERGSRQGSTVTLVDVLERVLTKGIVIAYEADVSVLGLHVIGAGGHAAIMSLETYVSMHQPSSAETGSSEALMSAVDEYLRRLPPGNVTDTMP